MHQKQMFLNCQIKTVPSSADGRTVCGYTSTWGLDSVRDKVKKRAFEKSIKERFQNQIDLGQAPKIKVLYQHNPAEPVGVPTVLREDKQGLYFEARITKTRLGDEVLEMVKDGTISSMSIGFVIIKDEYDHKADIRYINEAKLVEFSFVTFPANEEATITGWKNSMEKLYSFEDEMDKKIKEAVEKALSDAKETWQTGEPTSVTISDEGKSITVDGSVDITIHKEYPNNEDDDDDEDDEDSSSDLEEKATFSKGSVQISVDTDALVEKLKAAISVNEASIEKMLLDKLNDNEYIEKVGRTISSRNEAILRDIVQALAPLKALLDELSTVEQTEVSDETEAETSVAVEEANVEVSNESPTSEVSTESAPDLGDTLLQELQNVDWSNLLLTPIDTSSNISGGNES